MSLVRHLLLTGPPGIGKTTAVASVAGLLGHRRIGGFITEEIRESGRRVGFALIPFGGERRIMAHRNLISSHRVGAYGVDVEMIDYVSDLYLSVHLDVDIFLIDEIGKMECFSRHFLRAVERLLQRERPVLATVARGGGGVIDRVKQRPDVELWQLTADNRRQIPDRAAVWLRDRIGGE